VQETCMTMQRMRALEAVGPGCDPLLLNPFAESRCVEAEAEAAAVVAASGAAVALADASSSAADPLVSDATPFVSSIASSIRRAEEIRRSKSSWLFAVLPGLQNKEQEQHEEDIDPELDGAHYKTADELLLLNNAHDQPFSLKNFTYAAKLFAYELEPLMRGIACMKYLRDWENPIVTLLTVICLMQMCIRDCLGYLPAVVMLINIGVIGVLKYYPDALAIALGSEEEDAARLKAAHAAAGNMNAGMNEEGIVGATPMSPASTTELREYLDDPAALSDADRPHAVKSIVVASSPARPAKIATAVPVAQPIAAGGAVKEAGFFDKLVHYRDVATKTRNYLHSIQNGIGRQNIKMMKIEGLYKWRSPQVTQRYLGIMCGAFVVLALIPFRFIFPFIGQRSTYAGTRPHAHIHTRTYTHTLRQSRKPIHVHERTQINRQTYVAPAHSLMPW
jgi:hypothetical protein